MAGLCVTLVFLDVISAESAADAAKNWASWAHFWWCFAARACCSARTSYLLARESLPFVYSCSAFRTCFSALRDSLSAAFACFLTCLLRLLRSRSVCTPDATPTPRVTVGGTSGAVDVKALVVDVYAVVGGTLSTYVVVVDVNAAGEVVVLVNIGEVVVLVNTGEVVGVEKVEVVSVGVVGVAAESVGFMIVAFEGLT